MRKSFKEVFGVTDKQRECINNIQYYTNHKFNGTTKWEASEFISKYLQLSKSNVAYTRKFLRSWRYEIKERQRRHRRCYCDEEMLDFFDISLFT